MTELEKVNLKKNNFTGRENLIKSLNTNDIKGIFGGHELSAKYLGKAGEFPATTVVFDLANSSYDIRNEGAIKKGKEIQKIFNELTGIIYKNSGVVEKFPGDGISMHFPAIFKNSEVPYKKNSILNALNAVKQMDDYLLTVKALNKKEYRFSLSYGEDTIVTVIGNNQHFELITLGYGVNIAHKLEKIIKDNDCYIGMDKTCYEIVSSSRYNIWSLQQYEMPNYLKEIEDNKEAKWYGVKIH